MLGGGLEELQEKGSGEVGSSAKLRLLSCIQELLGEVLEWCQVDERNVFPDLLVARKPHSRCQ